MMIMRNKLKICSKLTIHKYDILSMINIHAKKPHTDPFTVSYFSICMLQFYCTVVSQIL